MPLLVLVHGAPASGKSTLAHRWADSRPLTLVLDVDVVRSLLGAWAADAGAAGIVARRLALQLARAHLTDGRDVVVPQLLLRPGLAEELVALAHEVGASFVEVALDVPAETAQRRFEHRAAHTAYGSVHGPLGAASMAEVVDAHRVYLATRPGVALVVPVEGDLEESARRLAAAIDAAPET